MDGLDRFLDTTDIPEYMCDEEAIQNCITSLTESLYEVEQNDLPPLNNGVVAPSDVPIEVFNNQFQQNDLPPLNNEEALVPSDISIQEFNNQFQQNDLPPLNNEQIFAPLDISVQDFEVQNNLHLAPSNFPDCHECILLREIVHTNGVGNMKLWVHGGKDLFFHAICQVEGSVDGMQSVVEPSFVDLRGFSYEQVKQFLMDYGLLRIQNGYVLIQDSISSFYDALSVKIDCNMPPILHEQAVVSQSTPAVSNNPMQLPVNVSSGTEKTGIAAQRERTANLHISEFADYFHLRLVDAAKEIGVCSTVLKKVCRKYGMQRWPYRKVSSIDKKINKLQNDLQGRGGQGAAEIKAEIEKLIAERANLCLGYNPYITPYT